MEKANQDLRHAIKESGIPQWRIAKRYGLSDNRFSVILRYELNDDKTQAVLQAIEDLKKEMD